MPNPTEEQKRKSLIVEGYDPDKYQYDDNYQVVPKAAPMTRRQALMSPEAKYGTLETAGMHAAGGIMPTASALSGGAMAAHGLSKLAPHPLVKIGGSLAGAMLSGMAGSMAQEQVLPDEWNKALAESAMENPKSAMAGNVAAAVPFLRPDFKAFGSASQLAQNLLKGKPVSGNQINAAANVAGGAGIGAGMSMYDDIASDQPINWGKAGIAAAGESILNNPRTWLERFGFTPNQYDPDVKGQFNAALGDASIPTAKPKVKAEQPNTVEDINTEVDPLDVIQPNREKFEQKKRDKDLAGYTAPQLDPNIRAQTNVENARVADKPTEAFKKLATEFFGSWRNYGIKEDPTLQARGAYDEDPRQITINPSPTRADGTAVDPWAQTYFHEAGHGFITDLLHSKNNSDRRFARKLVKAVEESEAFAEWKAGNTLDPANRSAWHKKVNEWMNKPIHDRLNKAVDEFIADFGGIKAMEQIKANKPQVWSDTFSYLKKKWTGKQDANDYIDLFADRLLTDPSFKETGLGARLASSVERYADLDDDTLSKIGEARLSDEDLKPYKDLLAKGKYNEAMQHIKQALYRQAVSDAMVKLIDPESVIDTDFDAELQAARRKQEYDDLKDDYDTSKYTPTDQDALFDRTIDNIVNYQRTQAGFPMQISDQQVAKFVDLDSLHQTSRYLREVTAFTNRARHGNVYSLRDATQTFFTGLRFLALEAKSYRQISGLVKRIHKYPEKYMGGTFYRKALNMRAENKNSRSYDRELGSSIELLLNPPAQRAVTHTLGRQTLYSIRGIDPPEYRYTSARHITALFLDSIPLHQQYNDAVQNILETYADNTSIAKTQLTQKLLQKLGIQSKKEKANILMTQYHPDYADVAGNFYHVFGPKYKVLIDQIDRNQLSIHPAIISWAVDNPNWQNKSFRLNGPNQEQIDIPYTRAIRELSFRELDEITTNKKLEAEAEKAYIESVYDDEFSTLPPNSLKLTENIKAPQTVKDIRALADKYQNCLATYVKAAKRGDTYIVETSNAVAEIRPDNTLIQHFGVANKLPAQQDIDEMIVFGKANNLMLDQKTWISVRDVYEKHLPTRANRMQEIEEDPVLSYVINDFLGPDEQIKYKQVIETGEPEALIAYQNNIQVRLTEAASSRRKFDEMQRSITGDTKRAETSDADFKDARVDRQQEVGPSPFDSKDRIYRHTKSRTVSSALNEIQLSSNERYADLARHLVTVIDPSVGLKRITPIGEYKLTQGYYHHGKPDQHRSGYITTAEETTGQLLMHEILHAATVEKILTIPRANATEGYEHGIALKNYLARPDGDPNIQELIRVYFKVIDEFGLADDFFGKGPNIEVEADDGVVRKIDYPVANMTTDVTDSANHYGLANLQEFITESFTDKHFQAALSTVRYESNQTLWSKFVNIIKDMFGFRGSGNALEGAINATDRLINTPDPTDRSVRRFQELEDDEFFSTAAARELKNPKPFGLIPNKDGKVKANTLASRIRARVPAAEVKTLNLRLHNLEKKGAEYVSLDEVAEIMQGAKYPITTFEASPKADGPIEKLADLYKESIHQLDGLHTDSNTYYDVITNNFVDRRDYILVNASGTPLVAFSARKDGKPSKLLYQQKFKELFGDKSLMDLVLDHRNVGRETQLAAHRFQTAFDRANLLVEAGGNAGDLSANSPKSTTNWQDYGPKPADKMDDYVELSVQKDGSIDTSSEVHMFPEGTMVHVRGYMEGSGKDKTFHVIELQSDMESTQQSRLDSIDAQIGRREKDIRNSKAHIAEQEQAIHRLETNNEEFSQSSHKIMRDATVQENDRRIKQAQGRIQQYEQNLKFAQESIKTLTAEKSSSTAPELENYHAIGIKAAIRHAVKNGAKRIAVSDVKTSMITQGHMQLSDAALTSPKYKTSEEADKFWDAYWEARGVGKHEDGDWNSVAGEITSRGDIARGFDWDLRNAKLSAAQLRKIGARLPREEGHRINYEKKLPSIINKLLGTKAHKESFGPSSASEHYHGDVDAELGDAAKYFDTDKGFNVEANVWDIPADRAKLFLEQPTQTFSKRYQDVDPHDPVITKLPSLYVDNWLTSQVDTVRAAEGGGLSQTFLAERATEYYRQKRFNEGRWANRAAMFFEGYKPEKGREEAIVKYLWETRHGEASTIQLNEQEKSIVALWKKHLKEIAKYHKSIGMKVRSFGKDGKAKHRSIYENPDYSPDMPSVDVIHHMTNHASDTDARAGQLKQDFIDWSIDKGGMTEAKAEEYYNDYIDAVTGARNLRGAQDSTLFNALRKAQGMGLPWSWVEKNPVALANRYGRRVAHDLAFFETMQGDPITRWISGIVDQEGNKPEKMQGYRQINDNPAVRDLMHGILQGDAPLANASRVAQTRIMAAARLVSNSIMGVGTGLRDIMAMPAQASPYIKLSDLPKIFSAAGRLFGVRKRALEAGATQLNYDNLQYGDLSYANPDGFVKHVSHLSQILRKWGGRETLENFSRHLTFALGEELAVTRIAESKAGDDGAKRWLQAFGKSVNWKRDSELIKIQKIAKEFTDRVQGAYDAEGLPGLAIDSQVAPFLNLARWSIEKYNVIKRDVVMEAQRGNWSPLLKYVFGTLLSGAAVEQLNELLSNKRGHDPTMKEAFLSGDADDITLKVIGLAQLGAFAGIGSDATKILFSLGSGDIAYNNPLSFPLYTFVTDAVAQNTADAITAIRDGADPLDTMASLIHTIAVQSNQNARYLNAYANSDETQRKERYRDLAVFKKMNGEVDGLSDIRANRFLDPEVKEFKRTKDFKEAVELAPKLLKQAIKKADGDPYKLKAELRKLKQNNYQTMPNPANMPSEFIKYLNHLRKTQGNDAAAERLRDFLMQNQLNKSKSKLIP